MEKTRELRELQYRIERMRLLVKHLVKDQISEEIFYQKMDDHIKYARIYLDQIKPCGLAVPRDCPPGGEWV